MVDFILGWEKKAPKKSTKKGCLTVSTVKLGLKIN